MAKVHFYYSAMNAGKSTVLLQANYNYLERGLKPKLFIPQIDSRVGAGIIGSRIGLTAKAKCFNNEFDFTQHIKPQREDIDCVLIDEAQFLTKSQVEQICFIFQY